MEWKKISEEMVYDSYRKIVKRIFILPDGREQDYEIKKEGDSVCVVPITSHNTVVLAKQFRPGTEQVLMELPGGFKDFDEDALEAAKRELLEETGYTGDFQFVTMVVADGYSTRIRHVFVATNCKKIGEQQLDDIEFIEVLEMPIADFRDHLRSGQLTDVETGYLGLDFLGLL